MDKKIFSQPAAKFGKSRIADALEALSKMMLIHSAQQPMVIRIPKGEAVLSNDILAKGAFSGADFGNPSVNFTVEHIAPSEKSLEFINAVNASHDAMVRMLGVPRPLVDLKTSPGIRRETLKDSETLQSIHFNMMVSTQRLTMQMLYGSWDVQELDDTWKEEYKENDSFKTIPL